MATVCTSGCCFSAKSIVCGSGAIPQSYLSPRTQTLHRQHGRHPLAIYLLLITIARLPVGYWTLAPLSTAAVPRTRQHNRGVLVFFTEDEDLQQFCGYLSIIPKLGLR